MTTPLPPGSGSGAGPSGSGAGTEPVDPATVDAVQRALAAEHAALWVLQLATAFVTDQVRAAVVEAATAHRVRRDAAEALLRDFEVAPVAAEPAYATPTPVTNEKSAVTLLVTVESDVAAAWRSVVEFTDETAVRALAGEALTDAAVRATRWRRLAGLTPLTVPFPGTTP